MRAWLVALTVFAGVALIGVGQTSASGKKLSARNANLTLAVQGAQLMPVGDPTTYRILVANKGAKTARGIELHVTIPQGAHLVGSNARCRGTTELTCALPPLELAKFRYVRLTLIARDVGLGVLQAFVHTNQWESEYGDNADSLPVAYQRWPASADVSVSAAPEINPPEGWQPPPPSSKGFTVTITNPGPGDAVRVLVHYAFKGLFLNGWHSPGGSPDPIWPGVLQPSTTCGWEPLGMDRRPLPGLDKWDYCILVVNAGETRTYEIWMTQASTFGIPGPAGHDWSVKVDPLTPDPNPSNNFATAVF
jgi:hypothetical protein